MERTIATEQRISIQYPKSLDWKSLKKRETRRMQRVHVTTLLFLTIGLVQLFGLKYLKGEQMHSIPLPSFMYMVVGFVCLVLIVYSELQDKFPVNWTLAFVANLSMTLSIMSHTWSRLSLMDSTKAVVIVLVLNLMLNLFAIYLPLKLLPSYGFTLTVTFLFVVGYTVAMIVVFSISKRWPRIIVDVWCLLYISLLIFYSGTLIHNRHFEHAASKEFIFSASIIAHFFYYQLHIVCTIIFNYNDSRGITAKDVKIWEYQLILEN